MKEDRVKHFGKWVAWARLGLGMTRTQFAVAAGVEPRTMSRIESARRPASNEETYIGMANALGIGMERLLTAWEQEPVLKNVPKRPKRSGGTATVVLLVDLPKDVAATMRGWATSRKATAPGVLAALAGREWGGTAGAAAWKALAADATGNSERSEVVALPSGIKIPAEVLGTDRELAKALHRDAPRPATEKQPTRESREDPRPGGSTGPSVAESAGRRRGTPG